MTLKLVPPLEETLPKLSNQDLLLARMCVPLVEQVIGDIPVEIKELLCELLSRQDEAASLVAKRMYDILEED